MASDKILCSVSWYVLCYVVPSVMYIVVHAFVYTEQSLLMLSLQLWFLNNALADRRMYRSYYIFSFFSPCVLLSSVFCGLVPTRSRLIVSCSSMAKPVQCRVFITFCSIPIFTYFCWNKNLKCTPTHTLDPTISDTLNTYRTIFFLFHLIVFLLAINLSLLFSWATTTLNWLLFCSNTRQRNERRCRCFCAKSFLPFCAPLCGQYRTCFSLCLDANKVFCYFFGTCIRLNERKTWKRSDSTSFVCDFVKDDSKKKYPKQYWLQHRW